MWGGNYISNKRHKLKNCIFSRIENKKLKFPDTNKGMLPKIVDHKVHWSTVLTFTSTYSISSGLKWV